MAAPAKQKKLSATSARSGRRNRLKESSREWNWSSILAKGYSIEQLLPMMPACRQPATLRLSSSLKMLRKIVSGGQTGVDRGALDAALDAGFPCGGWCPRGRKAEDGAIPPRYPMVEMQATAYRARTKQNVSESDGTLILFFGALSGGTLQTLRIAEALGKPVLTLDCNAKPIEDAAVEAAAFVRLNGLETLNVAGPRESSQPGAAQHARELVREIIDAAGKST
jgi:hypothetical protein